MQTVQMQVITYVPVNVDADTSIGIGPDGVYYRVNGTEFTAIEAKEAAKEYFDRDLRIPPAWR